MQFILRTSDDTRRCLQFLQALRLDIIQEIIVRPYKRNRSDAQNRLLWSWYKPIADHIGLTSEDLHELMKAKVLGFEVKELPRHLWGKIGLTNNVVLPKSTTRLTVEEMTNFLHAVEALSTELNITLPHPDEEMYAMYGERVK